jgi:hypothetical protein
LKRRHVDVQCAYHMTLRDEWRLEWGY